MRDAVTILVDRISVLEQRVELLQSHQHGENGRAMIPTHDVRVHAERNRHWGPDYL